MRLSGPGRRDKLIEQRFGALQTHRTQRFEAFYGNNQHTEGDFLRLI